MTRRRVLTAQGPSQLISVVAVCEYLAAQNPQDTYEDILVLGAFCVPDKIARELETGCREIARTWKFHRIVPVRRWDAAIAAGKMTFDSYVKRLAAEVGPAETVFVSRNMQPLNEAALYAWPKAMKICYGDLGMIDLNGAPWSKPMKETGYPPVDQIITHAPVERNPGNFRQYPLTQIPLDFFTHALSKASSAVYGIDALCRELSKNCGPKKILLCPTNFTESGNVHTVEEEIQFHEACLAPHIEKGCTIFIKGHPRQTMNQAARLTARLCSKGYDARCFPAYNAVPVDLFARALRVDLFLSLFSHSGVVWRLVQPETDILFGVPRELVQKFILPSANEMFRYNEVTALYYLLGIMGTRREYHPLRIESVRQILHAAPQAPILLRGRKSPDAPLDAISNKFFELALRTEAERS